MTMSIRSLPGSYALAIAVTLLLAARPAQSHAHLGFLQHRSSVNASADSSAAASAPIRIEICRFCYRRCSVSCSVGTCGLQYGFSVQRYKASSQCYSCDAVSSVGTAVSGDFALCSADDAGATNTYLNMAEPPVGSAAKGPAAQTAGEAAVSAHQTVVTAEDASSKAARAAREALGHYNAISGHLAGAADAAQAAQAHQLATQIRANEALRVAQAAHVEWEDALKAYNIEVDKLRAQQLRTDQYEEALARAEQASERARAEYVRLAGLSAQAAKDAAMTGDDTSAAMAAQAQAMELAASARAAQRRLTVAAKAAHDAGLKLGIAAGINLPDSLEPQPTLPPCVTFLQGAADGSKNCAPPSGAAMPSAQAPANVAPNPVAADAVPPFPAIPQQGPLMTPEQYAAISGDPNLNGIMKLGVNGMPDEKFLSNEMTQQLASRIAENPNAAADPTLYGIPGAAQSGPSMPGMPGPMPGMPPMPAGMPGMPAMPGMPVMR